MIWYNFVKKLYKKIIVQDSIQVIKNVLKNLME